MKIQYKLTIIILGILWISIGTLSLSSSYLAKKALKQKYEKRLIAAEISLEDINSITSEINRSVAVHSAAISVITILFVWSFARYMSNRLVNLRKAVEKVSEGSLDYKIQTSQKDEINELALSFDKLRLEIKNLKQDLEEQVRKRTNELNKEIANLEKLRDLTVDSEIYAENMRKENEKLIIDLTKIKNKKKI